MRLPGQRSARRATSPEARPSRSATPELLGQLHGELAASAVSGRALFLQGHAGAGMDVIVSDFVHQARRANRRLSSAVASAADPQIPAWRQIAFRLTGRHRAGAALRRSVGEWVFIIPVIGNAISAVLSTIDELSDRPVPQSALGTGSSIDDVRSILAHGRNEPRLIVLTECEAADPAELSGAFALIQQISTTRTLLLVTTAGDDPSPRGFRDLLWEAERLNVGRVIVVEPAITPAQRELLGCAAGLGARFEVAQLAHALGQSEALVERQLDALIRARVVVLRDTVDRDGDLVDVYTFAKSADSRRPGVDTDTPPTGDTPAGA